MKLEYSVNIKFSVENADFHPTNEEIEKTIAMLLEDELGVSVESIFTDLKNHIR